MPRPWNPLPLVAVLMLACAPAPAQETLLLMEPEIDGDTSPHGPAAWKDRLEILESYIAETIAEKGIYQVVDSTLAEESFAKHRRRADVHACTPCATESARQAAADRVLSVWVFRVSNLVLSMQAIVRDGETGDVRYATAHDFRGDSDDAWLHAARRLVVGLGEIPPELR